jgi:hypothetical protein
MRLHVETVAPESVGVVLSAIRRAAGTIVRCERIEARNSCVTWTTVV